MTFEDIYKEIQSMISDDDTSEILPKIKKAINEVYDEICNMEDWRWLIKTLSIITKENYNTGTVALVNGSNAVVGTGTDFTSAMEGMKFIHPDFPKVYTVDTVADTEHLTLTANYDGDDDSAVGFLIFENEYALPSDFRRPFSAKLDSRPLDQMDLRDYRKIQPTWIGSQPTDYVINGSNVIFYRIPDLKYYCEFDYYSTPANLVATSDVPLIPKQFHQILVFGGYRRVNAKLEDIDYNKKYESLYDVILQNLYINNEIDSDEEDSFLE